MPPGYTHLGVGQLGECLLGLDWLQELHNGCDASSWEQHPAQAAMFAKDSLQLCCACGGWEVLHQDHSFTPLTSSLTHSVGEEEKEDVGLQKAKNNLLLTEDFILNTVCSLMPCHTFPRSKSAKNLLRKGLLLKRSTPQHKPHYTNSHTHRFQLQLHPATKDLISATNMLSCRSMYFNYPKHHFICKSSEQLKTILIVQSCTMLRIN